MQMAFSRQCFILILLCFLNLIDSLSSSSYNGVRPSDYSSEVEIYEANLDRNTISVRLRPLSPAQYGVDQYRVFIPEESGQEHEEAVIFEVSKGLECTLWEDSVCLENYPLPPDIALANVTSDTDTCIIKVHGVRNDSKEMGWTDVFELGFYTEPPSPPTNFTLASHTNGIVNVKWGHPLFPNGKIKEFRIVVEYLDTRLLEYQSKENLTIFKYCVEEEQMEYKTELRLLTSTKYSISIRAISQNQVNGTEVSGTIWVPSGVDFANGEKLQVKVDGTSIQLKPPTVVNATGETVVSVIVKRPLTRASSLPNNFTKWVAAEYKLDDEKPKIVRIGGNEAYNLPLNCTLQYGEVYTVEVNVEDKYSNVSNTLTSLPITLSLTGAEIFAKVQWLDLACFLIIIIAVVCLLPLYIWHGKRKRVARQSRKPEEPTYDEITSDTKTNTKISTFLGAVNKIYNTVRRLESSTREERNFAEVDLPPSLTINVSNPQYFPDSSITQLSKSEENELPGPEYQTLNDSVSRSVSVRYFEEYVKKAHDERELLSQFELLRGDQTRSCDCGSLPENIHKNRDKNLIAYDDTRVVLRNVAGDDSSDYINANYIQGYKNDRGYIATQRPKSNTVNDFWRMIWQEKVRVICMLSDVIEGAEKKSEQYWPDVGSTKRFGYFLVTTMSEQVFADYTFRTFLLSRVSDTQKVLSTYTSSKLQVTHLHYTGWPSPGMPIYPQPLVTYLTKLNAIPTGNAPVVVHCHTGDDWTGIVILCDICLRQAAAEKAIDVLAVAKRMCYSRANMVSTPQHYLLSHIIISESMMHLSTEIPCDKMLPIRIRKMKEKLPSDLERLNDTMWQEQALKAFAADNLAELVRASPKEADSCDQLFETNRVNAMSVDGVRVKNEYFVSSLPSPLNINNFWEFVVEKNIKLIVLLQCSDPTDPTCYDILPNKSIGLPMLDIRVKNKRTHSEEEYFKTQKLSITNHSQKDAVTHSVTVITCRGWGCGENGKPPPTTTLVSLWGASEKIPRKGGQTLVLCNDGMTGCCLYLALSYLLQRMALERKCDVISAVRAVRRFRSGFMQSLEQCKYLYDAAENYAESFQHYSNFT